MSLKNKIIIWLSVIAALYLMLQGKRSNNYWVCGILKTYECQGILNIIVQAAVFFIIIAVILGLILFLLKIFLKNTKKYIKTKRVKKKETKTAKKEAKKSKSKEKEAAENEEEINGNFETEDILGPDEELEDAEVSETAEKVIPNKNEVEKEINKLKTELREEKEPKETIIKI